VRCDKGKEEKGDETSENIKNKKLNSCGMVHEKRDGRGWREKR